MIIIIQYRNVMSADLILQYYASFVFSDIQFKELYLKWEFIKEYYLTNIIEFLSNRNYTREKDQHFPTDYSEISTFIRNLIRKPSIRAATEIYQNVLNIKK